MLSERPGAPSGEERRAPSLTISAGQHSDKGRKPDNQDFHGILIPHEAQLRSKGIAVALADGISSSEVSQIASRTAVAAFLEDYYCTSEAWSVKTSAERVLNATNAWLYAHTQQGQGRYDKDRGYVCTLSALVLRSTTAHLFHVGDSRVYRARSGALERLTREHRLQVSREQSYLTRALGMHPQLEIDYLTLRLEEGDVFVLATDGVHEYLDDDFVLDAVAGPASDPQAAARQLVEEACRRGSGDNLTVQVVRIDRLPDPQAGEIRQQLSELAPAPLPAVGSGFEGYTILRELHGSSRSHVYLARDEASGALTALKMPSVELRADPAYLERFMMEEWIARRIDSPHVVKPFLPPRSRRHLYVATEFVDGQSLTQWMADHPRPALETVRGIVEQIGRGLRAFHRLEMLHRDLRPDNILIDASGTLKIIDFGSTRVAGIADGAAADDGLTVPGALAYAAPEYFLGGHGDTASDIYSLGVITYQMLSGHLPYGTRVARCKTRAAQQKLRCRPLRGDRPDVPEWVDEAIRKAVRPDPLRRYADVAEYLADLRRPDPALAGRRRPPLLERDPLLFWKGVSLLLAVLLLLAVRALYGG